MIIKKLIKNILKVIAIILLILLILYNFININNERKILDLFGYKIVVVEKYQEQNNIENNDIIIGRKNNDGYQVDDLVIMRMNGALYFHRIVRVKSNGEYITKGDENYSPDKDSVKETDIEGKVVGQIDNIGIILKIAKTNFFSIIILLMSIMIFVYSAHIYKKRVKRRFKQKNNKSEI